MKIKRLTGGTIRSNGYIIYQKEGGSCYIIDPGYRYKSYVRFIEENGLRPAGIILTHSHYDHVGAVENIRKEFQCDVFIEVHEMDMYGKEATPIYDGDVFDLEGEKLTVVRTPGHSPGSICLVSQKGDVAFTGDTVFNVDLGRSDLFGGSEEDMEKTIREIVDRWPDHLEIYPGHGDNCSMKYVRSVNEEFNDIVSGKGRMTI